MLVCEHHVHPFRSHEQQPLRTSWVYPCPNSSFCAMGDSEVSSTFGSEPQKSPPMEATSPSEVEEGEQPKRPGRGRGRGSGRGHAASSSTHPKPKRVINKSRGHQRQPKARKPKTSLSWLRQPTSQEDGDMEVTSASEETDRIAAAGNRPKAWHDNAECTSSSDEQITTAAASDGHSMPNSSGVFDYATWLVGQMSHEQRLKLTRSFTWVDLCAGLGTPFIAYEALRRALQPYGLCPAGECNGLTEKSKDRRDALGRRMVHAASSAPIFISNADLTSRLPKEDRGNVHDLPISDHLFMGIVCVDIRRCSSTPKSRTDASGSSGKSWLDFLEYLDLLTFEQRPTTITFECVDNLSSSRTRQAHRERHHPRP